MNTGSIASSAAVRWGRTAAAVVLAASALNWVGWSTGAEWLTRVNAAWPPMLPWTALMLAALGTAILAQSGTPSAARVWVGRCLAVAVGTVAVLILVEFATGRTFGVDEVWFGDSLPNPQTAWPGRPGRQVAFSLLLLSIAVATARVTRPRSPAMWLSCLLAGMVMPWIAALAYLFRSVALVRIAESAGMALTTSLSTMLLGVATLTLRPERNPVAWMRSRLNRGILLRLAGIFVGFPVLVGLFLRLLIGVVGEDVGETLSTALGTVILGVTTFYLSRREQRLIDALGADRAVLRATADGMLDPQILLEAVRDSDGRVRDLVCRSANHATREHLGLAEGDLVGRSALEVMPNIESSGLISHIERCLTDGEPVMLEDFPLRGGTADESRRFDIRITRAGADLLTFSWADVSERFRSAQRLAASEENYRLLVENADDVVSRIRDDVFIWVTPSAETVLGAVAQHWLGRPVREIIPAEDLPAHTARWRKLSEGGEVKQRIRIVTPDGDIHWVHLYAKPFYDAAGRRDGLTAAFRLIDDEVAAEQVLEETRHQRIRAEQRYRRSVDNAAIGMGLVTPDGRFYEVNDSLCRFFGYDAETLKRKTWQELTAPEFLETDLKNVEDLREGRADSYRMVKQFIHADGHPIWGDLSVSCVRNDDGSVENFISQITDISAVVAADERNLVLARRLQEQSDRMAAELQSAAAYVASILPRGLDGSVEVESRYLSAQELGGDCFDYAWIDDEHLIVYLIDVSGHGLESALLAVSLHNLLRSGSIDRETLLRPEMALAELNRRFQMGQHSEHYFTMWFGVYEAPTRTLRYVGAGCPPALAINAGDDGSAVAVTVTELPAESMPVAMFEDAVFSSAVYLVPHGCHILVYSDGASEIIGAGGQLSQRDFEKLAANLALPDGLTLDGFVDTLRNMTSEGAFEDDCSLIQLTFD